MGFFIAVHVGAGSHALSKHPKYKKCLCKACLAAETCLKLGGTALQAVAAAIQVLEDDPFTNAGMGSNLTETGHVEVDASIMDGSGQTGAVGAVQGMQNPIVAAALLAERCWQPMPLGRVRPQLLVGEPARAWALQQGLTVAETPEEANNMLVTQESYQMWKQYSEMILQANHRGNLPQSTAAACNPAIPLVGLALESVAEAPTRSNGEESQRLSGHEDWLPASKRPEMQGGNNRDNATPSMLGTAQPDAASDPAVAWMPEVADTVGCICVDDRGRVAAGVSSGGIAMKADGRVGEAALPGCGCWAQHPAANRPGVCVSVSGVGERIMSAVLAKECGHQLQAQVRAPLRKAVSMPYSVESQPNGAVTQGMAVSNPEATLQGVEFSPSLDKPIHKGMLPLDTDMEEQEELQESNMAGEEADIYRTAGEVCSNTVLRSLSTQVGPWDAGVLAAVVHASQQQVAVEFAAVHTAESFGVAFHHAEMQKPKAMILQSGSLRGKLPPRSCPSSCCQFGCLVHWTVT